MINVSLWKRVETSLLSLFFSGLCRDIGRQSVEEREKKEVEDGGIRRGKERERGEEGITSLSPSLLSPFSSLLGVFSGSPLVLFLPI